MIVTFNQNKNEVIQICINDQQGNNIDLLSDGLKNNGSSEANNGIRNSLFSSYSYRFTYDILDWA
jgi:Tol biopolymer transport system component